MTMGLFKRGKVWWMSFMYRGEQIRRSTETGDKKLAEQIYRKVMTEVVEGKWFERLPERSFKEMMDKYESEHVSQKRSARQYRGYIKNLRSFFNDECLLSEITPSMINEYKMKRRKEGVGPASINRELAVLKNAFNKALREWGWVRENPVMKIPMEKEPPGRVRYLTDEEFAKLLEACPEWLKPIVLTARHTGLRKENILSLKWHQVDLFRRVITIERTKSGERLGIPLNDTLMELFKKLSKVRYIGSEYVFYHPTAKKKNAKGTFDGRRYYEVKTSFQEALKKAGIENFRFHDLRHCFASALVQRGVDPFEVQRLLGHKSHAMTQRYAHLAPENLRKAVLRLDEKESEKSFSTNLAQLGVSSNLPSG
jgi:integrase